MYYNLQQITTQSVVSSVSRVSWERPLLVSNLQMSLAFSLSNQPSALCPEFLAQLKISSIHYCFFFHLLFGWLDLALALASYIRWLLGVLSAIQLYFSIIKVMQG